MMKSRATKKPNTESKKKSTQKKKYPLRGKPVIYRKPFKPVDLGASQNSPRVPGIDKGKIIIMPDFDDPIEEFEE